MPFQQLTDVKESGVVIGPLSSMGKQLDEKGYCAAVACEKLTMQGFSWSAGYGDAW